MPPENEAQETEVQETPETETPETEVEPEQEPEAAETAEEVEEEALPLTEDDLIASLAQDDLEPEQGEPVTDSENVEVEGADEGGDVVMSQADYDAMIADLNRLSAGQQQGEQPAAQQEPVQGEQEGEQQSEQPAEPTQEQYGQQVLSAFELSPPKFTNEQFDEMLASPDKLSAAFHQYGQQVLQTSVNAAAQSLTPRLFKMVNDTLVVDRAVTKFMAANPQFEPVADRFSLAVRDVVRENPDLLPAYQIDSILDKAKTKMGYIAKVRRGIEKSRRVQTRPVGRHNPAGTNPRQDRTPVPNQRPAKDPTEAAYDAILQSQSY